MPDAYQELLKIYAEVKDLQAVGNLLSWDQETQMPPKGAARRAEQVSIVSRLVHEQITADRVGDLLAEACEADHDLYGRANLRELRRAYDRKKKIPAELVADLARTTALAFEHWKEARQRNEFLRFAPWLEKIVRLKRQEAACLDSGERPYDQLLDEYEPGMTTEELQALFRDLRPRLTDLVGRVQASGVRPRTDYLGNRDYPIPAQEAFARAVVTQMGFDFEAGRVDVAAHPFCSSLSVDDVRLTLRYDARDPRPSLFGLVHEAGHGLYEQGYDRAREREPIGDAISLGIHESQSRLWENCVARSRPFWKHWFPRLVETFPAQLSGVSADEWYGAVNEVGPSLIRVEADEVTYNLHIILRMELEIALVQDELAVADLPGAWNDKMQEYLGLRPPTDADGVLQDIHWSVGLIGYFPTYTLGNLYGAQLVEALRRDIPDMDLQVERGQLLAVRDWMRRQVHQQGRLYSPPELVERATGSPPSPEPLVRYLEGKMQELYRV